MPGRAQPSRPGCTWKLVGRPGRAAPGWPNRVMVSSGAGVLPTGPIRLANFYGAAWTDEAAEIVVDQDVGGSGGK